MADTEDSFSEDSFSAEWQSRFRLNLGGVVGDGVVEYHETLSSTQLRAHDLAREGLPRAVVVADEQTAGRGRSTRRWESPKNSGLYVSILFRPLFLPAIMHFVSVASALSVAEAVRGLLGSELRLKWPNDLLNDEGRKVCGILSESSVQGKTLDYCITGIGINLYEPPSLPPDVAARFGWLCRKGEKADRVELLSRVVKNFFGWIDAMESEGTARMLEVYREKCVSVGRTVKVETETESLTGTCSGIGDEGELILETPCGPRGFHVADITHAELG